MMKSILCILAIVYCNVVLAQQVSDTTGNEECIFVNPEFPAEYPGGMEALQAYLKKENQWIQKHAAISGVVYVRFKVKKDGTLSEIEIIKGLEGSCIDCNEEALRLVRNMPKWKPGLMYDKPVEIVMVVPIRFGDKK